MTRTRAAAAAAAIQQSQQPEAGDEQAEEGAELDMKPTPTFNGTLNRFRHVAVAVTGSTTASTSNASSRTPPSRSSPRQRVLKRTSREQSEGDTDFTSDPSASPRPGKKRRASSKYAHPSKYAHLKPLTDILEPNLICVFVGTNPGIQTATAGHAYAHPSNHFWKLLYKSGLTDRLCKPEEDVDLPRLYSMGNTNIVERPSRDAAELSKQEMAAGTASLEAKFRNYKPEAVCIVGKGIWEAIWRYRYGRNPKPAEFKYGWQDEKENMGNSEGEEELDANGQVWHGSRVFVTTSTSGLAASLKPAEKEAIWKPFGEWVQKRRAERAEVASTST